MTAYLTMIEVDKGFVKNMIILKGFVKLGDRLEENKNWRTFLEIENVFAIFLRFL